MKWAHGDFLFVFLLKLGLLGVAKNSLIPDKGTVRFSPGGVARTPANARKGE